MANVQTGYHWDETNPEQITGAKLNLTGSGTVTNITQSDFSGSFTGITVGTSPPTVFTGAAWFDTTQGAGEGILKIYDNGKWTAISQGFLGYNNGTSIARGHIVQYDSSLFPAVVGTIPISKTAAPVAGVVQLARPIGVAAEAAANGVHCVVITYGYCTVLKDAGTVTAGDTVVPSTTVAAASNGRGISGNVGSWGGAAGSASIGRWMDTSSAAADTEVPCFIYGATPASWVTFKNSGGTTVLNGVPTTGGAWTDAGAFATNPIGTIAHICTVALTVTVTNSVWLVALRMKGATVDIGSGAAELCTGAQIVAGANNYNSLRGQLIVAETTGVATNTLQYYVNGTPAATMNLLIKEVGVIVGGAIV